MKTKTMYAVSSLNNEIIGLSIQNDIDMQPEEAIEQQGMQFKIKATGKQTGKMSISREDGMPTSSETNMKMVMDMVTKNPQENSDLHVKMDMLALIKMEVTKK